MKSAIYQTYSSERGCRQKFKMMFRSWRQFDVWLLLNNEYTRLGGETSQRSHFRKLTSPIVRSSPSDLRTSLTRSFFFLLPTRSCSCSSSARRQSHVSLRVFSPRGKGRGESIKRWRWKILEKQIIICYAAAVMVTSDWHILDRIFRWKIQTETSRKRKRGRRKDETWSFYNEIDNHKRWLLN